MSFSVKVEGLDDVERALRRYGSQAEKVLDTNLAKAAVDTHRVAVKSIQRGPKSGAIYLRGRTRRHQASAPGQPPATDTGRLASSIGTLKDGNGWLVGTGEDYGRHLELGTLRIQPRPWLVPAAGEARKVLIDRLIDALKRIRA